MKKKRAEPTHGGARKGAGKKPLPVDKKKRTKCHTFDPDIVEFLETVGGESEWLNTIIRRSREFREWQQQQQGE